MAIHVKTSAPVDYSTPAFPSLYWPLHIKAGAANYLYYTRDIWRFTLLWTLIVYAVIHLVVAAWAVLMQIGKGNRSWQYAWAIPLVYAVIAGVEALLAGSIVGLMWVYLNNLRAFNSFSLFIASINTLVDLVQYTMLDTSECRHGFHLYGHGLMF